MPKEVSAEELSLMKEMERVYLATPFYGSRRMKAELNGQGIRVSRKRVLDLVGTARRIRDSRFWHKWGRYCGLGMRMLLIRAASGPIGYLL